MTTVARFRTVGTLIIRDLGKTIVPVVELRHTCLSSLSCLVTQQLWEPPYLNLVGRPV